MNCVHGRNSELRSGGSAEDSGLRTVRVDDIRLDLAQHRDQGAIGLPILPRPDGSLQFGQHAKIETAVTSTLFETSFRSQAGAGDQRDFVAVVTMLILDGQQCVFLCSADDQSRDEMDDVHAEADGVSLGVARS